MDTQRVNVYISGYGLTVFEIEQYNPIVNEWLNIGGTYDSYALAELQVNNFNMKQLAQKVAELQSVTAK